MSKFFLRTLVVGSAVAALAACGPKKGAQDSDRAKPATNVADENVGGPAPVPGELQVTGVKISEKDSSTVVRVETSQAPQDNYTVFKLTDPMRVVVDVQNSTMGDVGGPYNVGNGTVGEVSASFFEDEGNKVTRVMIGLDKLLEYTVTTEGNAIVLEIPREGPMPAVTELGTGVGAGGSNMAVASNPSGDAGAAPMATPEAAATEAPLFADSSADATPTPESLPAESVPAATPEPAATEAPLFSDATPAPSDTPMDATAMATPEPTPDMSMATPEPAFTPADSGSSMAEATPTPEAPLFSDSGSSTTDSSSMSTDSSSSTMDSAPAPTPTPKKSRSHKSTKVAMNNPSPSSGLIKMTALDWNNKDANVSRIIIKTAAPVQYQELTPEKNTVVLELSGVRVPKSLERALDTSEFKSAVKMVSTYQAGDNARVVVQLREDVSHRVTPSDNNTYYFDFDRPAGMTGGESVAANDASASMPAATDTTASAPAADASAMPMSSDSGSAMSEPMESAPAPQEPAMMATNTATPASQAGFRPAETLFMDPSTPMAATGASALAGLQAASEMENGPQKIYTGRRLNMDFKDADIGNVLRIIANVSKLNIVTSDAVTGKVTVRLINVPWDQALDIILQSKQLDMARQGNIIRIDTIANFAKERDDKKKSKEALSALLPKHTLLLPVSYATAADMKSRLDPFLSKEGSITIDDRTNTLLVQDHSEPLERIRQLAHTLDTQTPQVLIEARLVEARTSFSKTIGIQWGGSFNPNPTGLFFPNTFGVRGGNGPLTTGPRGTPDDNLAVNLPGPSVSSLALFLGNLGNTLDLDARLGALETTDEIKVISSPRIATLDNKPARISQGAKIPFLSTSAGGTNTQFVDATLDLNVTPHITADKSVFMTVTVRNNRPGTIAVGGQPSIDIAEANTEVLVKDGDTTVIGGIYVVNNTKSIQGVPLLSKIPFLGFLFRASTTSEDRRELLVFLTPRIITRSQAQARN